jgi:cytochrome c oxidase cbb3-type subunit III
MTLRSLNLAESLGLVVLVQLALPHAQLALSERQGAQQVEGAGQRVFTAQCGFCHGRDAMGGDSGPDLTRSPLVRDDVRGDKIGPVVREGRVDKGMPAFRLTDADLAAVVAFIHDQKGRAESPGARRSVDVADLQTGNADAGRQYFNGAGRCSTCHSPSGDLAGLANRAKGLELLQRMLYPSKGRGAAVTVTVASGEKISGALAYRDEFTIALTDASERYRSFATSQVTFTVSNPLDAHVEQLGKYTDDDMHNVLAYLQTLR